MTAASFVPIMKVILVRIAELLRGYQREIKGALMEAHSLLLGLVVSVLLARILDIDDFGEFASFQAGTLVALGLMRFGWPLLIVREISAALKTGKPEFVRGILLLSNRYIFGVIVIILIVSFVIWSYFSVERAFYWNFMILTGFLWVVLSIFDAVSRGFGAVVLGRASELVVRPLILTITLIAMYNILEKVTLSVAINLFTLATLMACIFSAAVRLQVERAAKLKPATPVMAYRAWGASLIQLGIIGVLGTLITQREILMLTALRSPEEVGIYRVASQIGLLSAFGLGIANLQFAPQFSASLAQNDHAAVQSLAVRSARFSLLLGLPVAILAIFLTEVVIKLLYGVQFLEAAWAMRIVALGQLVTALSGSAALILISGKQEILVLAVNAMALMIGVGLNVVLIPAYGATGSAIAFGGASICLNGILVGLVWRHYRVLSLPIRLNN